MMNHRFALTVMLSVAAIAAATGFLYAPFAAAQDAPVTLRAVSQYPSVAQGGTFVIAVEMAHKEHYHSWPAKEVKLPGDIDELAIRTSVGPEYNHPAMDAAVKAKKAEMEANGGKVDDDVLDNLPPIYTLPTWTRFQGTQYPTARLGKVADPSGAKPTVSVPLYDGAAVSYVCFKLNDDAPIGDLTVGIRVYSQSCNEQTCDMPREEVVRVTIKVVKSGIADLGAANEKPLFAGFDAGKVAVPPIATPVNPPKVVPVPPVQPKPAAQIASPAVAGGAVLWGQDLGSNIFVLAIAAMIGGFVLNLTPCVLPVIPIKVMSLTQHAKSRGHALVLGLWMAAGVVAFWTAIGLPMAVISRQLDPSQFIFGVWYVCLSIGLVVAVLGLGIMGLFTLNLPQSVYSIETKADSPMGSFFFGVLAAVLGLPCFGLMAGGLLAAAATMPATSIMVIFVGLGVGMAAPYLVLSVWPQLLKFIPRTGPASELVKQVLGILMLAAAAYFVTAGIQVLLSQYPYLAGSMVWWAVGFFVAVAGLWLIIRTWRITSSGVRRAIFTGLALVMTFGIGLFAQERLKADHANFLEREEALAAANKSGHIGAGDAPAGVWLDYTPELLASVRASGRPVFLDFTASWCITCKAWKAAVLDPLKPEFKSRGVVLMEVNCSFQGSPGSNFLSKLKRTGVPTWALYGPAAQTPQFVSVDKPSAATVLGAMDSAGISSAATTSAAPVGSNAGIGTTGGAIPTPVPPSR